MFIKGKTLGIAEEAKLFHIKYWETPSFLFTLLGFFTIALIILTYLLASKSLELEMVIISISGTAIATLLIGGLVVKGISKIIIIDRAKTEFISLASHQLRTPLSGIKWVLNLVLSGEYGSVSEPVKKMLREGYASNERMILLVDDLLNISRIESDKFIYELLPLRLGKLIDRAVKDLSQNLQEKNIKIEFSKQKESLPDVYGDKRKLKFVFQNLLDNAIKYSHHNGVVNIELEKVSEKEIQCSIIDRGIGIPKNQAGRMFEKFFRADNAVRNNIPGSGLGLYIAKNVIEHHQGKIWFESQEGRGAAFHFTLPVYHG